MYHSCPSDEMLNLLHSYQNGNTWPHSNVETKFPLLADLMELSTSFSRTDTSSFETWKEILELVTFFGILPLVYMGPSCGDTSDSWHHYRCAPNLNKDAATRTLCTLKVLLEHL